MTDDRLTKVRAEIKRLYNQSLADENRQAELGLKSAACTSYGKSKVCKELLSFIDSMQEEPKECMYSKDNYTDEDRKALCAGCEEKCKHDKSDDFTKALAECIHNAQCNVVDPMVFAETWKDELIKLSKCEEPVSEDLEKELSRLLKDCEIDSEYIHQDFLHIVANHFSDWQKERMMKNIWKPADGDDLPEIDREVVVLIKYNAQHNIHDEEYPTYRVGFGHRPNPNGWDGKNIDTNEVTHYTPKLYDKGGWNAPYISYWLDVKLPKEIEL